MRKQKEANLEQLGKGLIGRETEITQTWRGLFLAQPGALHFSPLGLGLGALVHLKAVQ